MRLLSHLHAYSIAIIIHAYDAIRAVNQTDATTNATTNSYGVDANSTAVLRALSGTYISCTVKATNGRLPDDGTFPMPQRRRSRIR